jgi:hypothetical protein
LPVVFAAVGRRLDYPIRLVKAREHQFCRWDDPITGEQFNIEGSSPGVNAYPDAHYRTWPKPMRPNDEQAFGYLKTLTPRRELADMVAHRAFQLADCKRYFDAVDTFVTALELDRPYASYAHAAVDTIEEWSRDVGRRLPRASVAIDFAFDPGYRSWPSIPQEVEKQVRWLISVENILACPAKRRIYLERTRWKGRPTPNQSMFAPSGIIREAPYV